jgi:hypothetical protein
MERARKSDREQDRIGIMQMVGHHKQRAAPRHILKTDDLESDKWHQCYEKDRPHDSKQPASQGSMPKIKRCARGGCLVSH